MVRGDEGRVRDLLGDRVLVAGAHPDDCELLAGVLLATWTGERKCVVVTTMASFDREKQARRDREIAAAMAVLGVKEWEVGPHVDADLVHDRTLTKYFDKMVREFQPTLVVTHKEDDFHQDHRAICQAMAAALRRSPATFLVGESYLWPLAEPTLYLDVTAGIETQLQALRCYESIIANGTFDPEAVRAFHRMRGHQTFRWEYAQAFRVTKALLGP